MQPLVLSLIGADRTGLVESLAEVVAAHGGSWERSHVTELAGMFAGVVLVHVPSEQVEAFRAALAPLREQGTLEVTIRAAEGDVQGPQDGDADRDVRFDVVGNDRPGIVREVSATLADLGVSIVELRTWVASAAMAGGSLFHAAAVVRLPSTLDEADLVGALEDLSDDLVVDVRAEA